MSVPGCRHRCCCICCGFHNTQTRSTIVLHSKNFGTIPICPLKQSNWKCVGENTHRNHHPVRVHLSGTPSFQGVFPESKCDVTCVRSDSKGNTPSRAVDMGHIFSLSSTFVHWWPLSRGVPSLNQEVISKEGVRSIAYPPSTVKGKTQGLSGSGPSSVVQSQKA